MGFFRKILNKIFKVEIEIKYDENNLDDSTLLENYLQLAKIITFNDENILATVHEIVNNTSEYVAKNIENFEDRGINVDIEEKENLIYFSFLDLLIDNNYAEEFDYKCELEEFEYLFLDLKQFKNNFSKCKIQNLDNEDTIDEWVEDLNNDWEKYDVAIIQFDIDSDSYILCPVNSRYTDQLEEIGETIDKEIIFDI